MSGFYESLVKARAELAAEERVYACDTCLDEKTVQGPPYADGQSDTSPCPDCSPFTLRSQRNIALEGLKVAEERCLKAEEHQTVAEYDRRQAENKKANAEERIATLRQQAGDLLATIHHDGGHYIAEHGWAKAFEDAQAKYQAVRDELAAIKGRQALFAALPDCGECGGNGLSTDQEPDAVISCPVCNGTGKATK